jgi:histidinol-phosphate aminotransferase
LVKAMRARAVLLRDRSTDPGCDGYVRITIGVEEHVTRGLAALEESLTEIGWERQQAVAPVDKPVSDDEREWE